MVFYYYCDLLQPSNNENTLDLENFKNSLIKINGLKFNKLINIMLLENLIFEVKEGFDYKSEDKLVSEFSKISFIFNDIDDINKLITKYCLDGEFNILKENNKYTFIVREE